MLAAIALLSHLIEAKEQPLVSLASCLAVHQVFDQSQADPETNRLKEMWVFRANANGTESH